MDQYQIPMSNLTQSKTRGRSAVFLARLGVFLFAFVFTVLSIINPFEKVQADTVYTSEAKAQFLSGSLLSSIDLSSILGLEGSSTSFTDGQTVLDDIDRSKLDLTALSLVHLDLGGGISIPFGDLIELGLINQYAESSGNGVALPF